MDRYLSVYVLDDGAVTRSVRYGEVQGGKPAFVRDFVGDDDELLLAVVLDRFGDRREVIEDVLCP